MGLDRAERARRLGYSKLVVDMLSAVKVQGDYVETISGTWKSLQDVDAKDAFYESELLPALQQYTGNIRRCSRLMAEERRGAGDRLVSWLSKHVPFKAADASSCRDESLAPLLAPLLAEASRKFK